MTLSDSDEQLHPVPAGEPVNWQENLFFILWNTVTQDGMMIHIQRVPGQGVQEARTVVSIGGEIATATVTGAFDTGQLVTGITMIPEIPYRRWRIHLDFDAEPGCGPHGFIAARPTGDIRVVADFTLDSVLPAADFAAGLAGMVSSLRSDPTGPQMGDQAHYEQGGTWTGTIRIGTREVSSGGLFVRDHSWGERHEHNEFQAFWTASCLDEGRMFCNAIGIPHGGGFAGIGMLVDEHGVRTTTDVAALFHPRPGLRTYDHVDIRFGAGIDATLDTVTQQHWPMYLPYSGRRRYDNNAMSFVRMGDCTGFGVIEWAHVLTAGETADLDEAAG
jgi:hypothetical protein